MKKLLSILVAICMAISVCVVPVAAEDVITVTVDSNKVDCAKYGQEPVIVEGRTLVPLRSVFEALGASVEWDNETRSVTSVKGEVTIALAVDSKEMIVNGIVKTLDVPAQIMNERTMVPVRAVAEAFGCDVKWDNDVRCVVITTVIVSGEMTPEEVVKQAMDASFKLDFEKAVKFFKNPDEVMGEYAGATDVSEIIGVAGGEGLTPEQVMLVEEFALAVMSLIKYEVTGSEIDGNTAEVYITANIPDFENLDIENAMTEEVMTAIYVQNLTTMGYTIDDMYSLTEDEQTMLANSVLEDVFEYLLEIIKQEDEKTYITANEVKKLEKIDGKWLIVE